MYPFKLICFDLDGTLAEYQTGALLPHVEEWFTNRPAGVKIAIATNQGGVGLRHWMETNGFGDPSQYPTQKAILTMLDALVLRLGGNIEVLVSFAYQSKKGGWGPVANAADKRWLADWRKPNPGMLIEAMNRACVEPSETLMVGDWDEDRLAAQAAGCSYMSADVFFKRGVPDDSEVGYTL